MSENSIGSETFENDKHQSLIDEEIENTTHENTDTTRVINEKSEKTAAEIVIFFDFLGIHHFPLFIDLCLKKSIKLCKTKNPCNDLYKINQENTFHCLTNILIIGPGQQSPTINSFLMILLVK